MKIRRAKAPVTLLGLIGFWLMGADAPESAPEATNDTSLPTEDYVLNGVPTPRRPWPATDYARAALALRELASEDTAKLPRYQSPLSGHVFARMIAAENLAPLLDEDIPVNARAAEGTRILGQVRNLLILYLQPTASGQYLDLEMVELLGFSLQGMRVTLPLLTAFLKEQSPDDPKFYGRVDGVEQVRESFNQLIVSAVAWLGARETYSREARLRLIAILLSSLPAIFPDLDDGMRDDTVIELSGVARDELDPEARAGLHRLISTLSDALQ